MRRLQNRKLKKRDIFDVEQYEPHIYEDLMIPELEENYENNYNGNELRLIPLAKYYELIAKLYSKSGSTAENTSLTVPTVSSTVTDTKYIDTNLTELCTRLLPEKVLGKILNLELELVKTTTTPALPDISTTPLPRIEEEDLQVDIVDNSTSEPYPFEDFDSILDELTTKSLDCENNSSILPADSRNIVISINIPNAAEKLSLPQPRNTSEQSSSQKSSKKKSENLSITSKKDRTESNQAGGTEKNFHSKNGIRETDQQQKNVSDRISNQKLSRIASKKVKTVSNGTNSCIVSSKENRPIQGETRGTLSVSKIIENIPLRIPSNSDYDSDDIMLPMDDTPTNMITPTAVIQKSAEISKYLTKKSKKHSIVEQPAISTIVTKSAIATIAMNSTNSTESEDKDLHSNVEPATISNVKSRKVASTAEMVEQLTTDISIEDTGFTNPLIDNEMMTHITERSTEDENQFSPVETTIRTSEENTQYSIVASSSTVTGSTESAAEMTSSVDKPTEDGTKSSTVQLTTMSWKENFQLSTGALPSVITVTKDVNFTENTEENTSFEETVQYSTQGNMDTTIFVFQTSSQAGEETTEFNESVENLSHLTVVDLTSTANSEYSSKERMTTLSSSISTYMTNPHINLSPTRTEIKSTVLSSNFIVKTNPESDSMPQSSQLPIQATTNNKNQSDIEDYEDITTVDTVTDGEIEELILADNTEVSHAAHAREVLNINETNHPIIQININLPNICPNCINSTCDDTTQNHTQQMSAVDSDYQIILKIPWNSFQNLFTAIPSARTTTIDQQNISVTGSSTDQHLERVVLTNYTSKWSSTLPTTPNQLGSTSTNVTKTGKHFHTTHASTTMPSSVLEALLANITTKILTESIPSTTYIIPSSMINANTTQTTSTIGTQIEPATFMIANTFPSETTSSNSSTTKFISSTVQQINLTTIESETTQQHSEPSAMQNVLSTIATANVNQQTFSPESTTSSPVTIEMTTSIIQQTNLTTTQQCTKSTHKTSSRKTHAPVYINLPTFTTPPTQPNNTTPKRPLFANVDFPNNYTFLTEKSSPEYNDNDDNTSSSMEPPEIEENEMYFDTTTVNLTVDSFNQITEFPETTETIPATIVKIKTAATTEATSPMEMIDVVGPKNIINKLVNTKKPTTTIAYKSTMNAFEYLDDLNHVKTSTIPPYSNTNGENTVYNTITSLPNTSRYLHFIDHSAALAQSSTNKIKQLLSNVNNALGLSNTEPSSQVTSTTIEATLQEPSPKNDAKTPESIETTTEKHLTSPPFVDLCSGNNSGRLPTCLCSIDNVLHDIEQILSNITEQNISMFDTLLDRYFCHNFIDIQKGIVIDADVVPTASRTKRLSSLAKREIVKELQLQSILSHTLDVKNTDEQIFATPGMAVQIPCVDSKSTDIFETQDMTFNWQDPDGNNVAVGKIQELDGTLSIDNVSPQMDGNYTCVAKAREHSASSAKRHKHQLAVINLPKYSLLTPMLYNTSQHCDVADVEVVNLYLSNKLAEYLCGTSARICKVRVEKAQCVARKDATTHMSLNIVAELENPKTIISHMGGNVCDLNCQLKIYTKLLIILTENMPKLLHSPVYFRLPYRQQDLVPEITPIMQTNGMLKLVTVCPPGFEIKKNFILCAPCNKGSFSMGDSPTCTRCPMNSYQHVKGASACIKCTSSFEDKNCIFLYANLSDYENYIYVCVVLFVILIITLLYCLCRPRVPVFESDEFRRRKRKRRVRRKNVATDDDADVETGLLSNLPRKSTKRLTSAPAPPPPDF